MSILEDLGPVLLLIFLLVPFFYMIYQLGVTEGRRQEGANSIRRLQRIQETLNTLPHVLKEASKHE